MSENPIHITDEQLAMVADGLEINRLTIELEKANRRISELEAALREIFALPPNSGKWKQIARKALEAK